MDPIVSPCFLNRRVFLNGSLSMIGGSIATELLANTNPKRGSADKINWPIGCFNRPWGGWSYEEALLAMRKAGFGLTGLLGDHKNEPFVQPEAPVGYREKLKERLSAGKWKANIVRLRTRHDIPVAECMESVRRQIDNAQFLGISSLFSMGVDAPGQYEHYCEVMRGACDYAAEKGMRIGVKPHGGISASANEILNCFEMVKRKNYGLWYDAGNIIHYTGKDPVEDVARVAHLVVGFCAKDCIGKGGDVMIQFGSGKVDFAGVFRVLKQAGFSGPIMVECCKGGDLEQTTENARKNREYLEKVLSSL